MPAFASAVPGLHALRAAYVQHCAYYSDIAVPRACGDGWLRLLFVAARIQSKVFWQQRAPTCDRELAMA
ncbi:hypothetical protein E2P81_ATG11233 [Venturia nashicola]|nr:hypothetical protein E2P81_ATG11233 [Venturia nashicola]